MAPASIVFPDPLFIFRPLTKTMNRGFTVYDSYGQEQTSAAFGIKERPCHQRQGLGF
jgi:hypothetical protein